AAVLTGACGGIGRGVAERLAEDGWRLVVTDLDGAKAEALAAELPGEGHRGLGCDVASETSVTQLFDMISKDYGIVDGLVTAAGILRL
ncbi:SDR family NAD(P)-dependent oxidoreductase, partial [Bacillus sp. NTK074B]|nr:SDR family NAD(P)-dependent oxidoreductase [Bacillus sp. NTK074B]